MFSAPLADVEAQIESLQKLVDQVKQSGAQELDAKQCNEAIKISQQIRNVTRKPTQIAQDITALSYQILAPQIAVDLRFFHTLSAAAPNPITADDLVKGAPAGTKVDVDFVIRFMRLVTIQGLANEVAFATYSANEATHAFTQEGMESLMGHWSDYYYAPIVESYRFFADNGYHLPTAGDAIGPFQSAWKSDLPSYAYWSTQPPHVLERFNRFMNVMHSTEWHEWMDAGPLIQKRLQAVGQENNKSALLFIDLGGGKGKNVHSLRHRLDAVGLASNPIILEDRPPVIHSLTHHEPGVEYLAHDFYDPQPPQAHGALYYYMRYVLHNWPDHKAIALLKLIAQAMRPGYSRLLINERVVKATGNDSYTAAIDVHMGFIHGAKERTLDQYRSLVREAGMEIVEFWVAPDGGQDVIECELVVN